MSYFKLVPLKIWLVAITLSLASAGYAGFVKYERYIGKQQQLLHESEVREATAHKAEQKAKDSAQTLLRAVHSKDSLLKLTTARLASSVTKYQSIRARTHDTVDVTDTAAVRLALAQRDSALALADSVATVAQRGLDEADSVIVGLLLVVDAKDSALAAADRRIAALQQINKIVKPSVRSRFGNIVKLGAAVGVGYLAGKHL